MSHFTRIRTQLRNLDTVKLALEDLGYEIEDAHEIRGYMGQEAEADIVVKGSAKYDIGFRREGDLIVMVGDFWGLKMDRREFLNQVSQRYAYRTVLEQADAQGWSKVEEVVQEDGSIKLVIQRWS